MSEYYGDKAAAADRQAETQGKKCAEGPVAPSPLRERLMSDAANLEGQHYRTSRALQILNAHPEFEEFIELLKLIDVGIRVKPFSALQALVLKSNA